MTGYLGRITRYHGFDMVRFEWRRLGLGGSSISREVFVARLGCFGSTPGRPRGYRSSHRRAAAGTETRRPVSACLLGTFFFFSLSPRKANDLGQTSSPNTGHHTGPPPPAREYISYHHHPSATTFHQEAPYSKRRETRFRPLVSRLRTSDERQSGAQKSPPSYRKATLPRVPPGGGTRRAAPLAAGEHGVRRDLEAGDWRVARCGRSRCYGFLGGRSSAGDASDDRWRWW